MIRHMRLIPPYSVCAIIALLTLAVGILGSRAHSEEPVAPSVNLFEERFDADTINPSIWVPIKEGDFQESVIDTVEVDKLDRRLRLRCATRGTNPETMKHHGLRTVEPVVDLTKPVEISFDIDWNNQQNGCYLSTGIYLCPSSTLKNPASEKFWLAIEYKGVFPGKNARLQVLAKQRWHPYPIPIFGDGWYSKERPEGRKIGKQHLRIVLSRDRINIWENGEFLYGTTFETTDLIPSPLEWANAYLYVQQSTSTNYGPREVFIDNILVRQVTEKAFAPLIERFNGVALDLNTWAFTRKNDFHEKETIIDVVGTSAKDRHLRMRASSIHTASNTSKSQGIRTNQPIIDLTHPVEIRYDLDWNKQYNGCYLEGALFICPTLTTGCPRDEPDYIKIAYTGSPGSKDQSPGTSAVLCVYRVRDNRIYGYFVQKVDPKDSDKPVGLMHLRVLLDKTRMQISRDGQIVYDHLFRDNRDLAMPLEWTTAYAYLQQSTINNYPPREIYWDNIMIIPRDNIEWPAQEFGENAIPFPK